MTPSQLEKTSSKYTIVYTPNLTYSGYPKHVSNFFQPANIAVMRMGKITCGIEHEHRNTNLSEGDLDRISGEMRQEEKKGE